MALAAETKRIVAQFEYSDTDVNIGVKEFLRQIEQRSSIEVWAPADFMIDKLLIVVFLVDEGLEKSGTSMSQIPTYVTAVPNGTEKGLYLAVDLGGTNLRVCSVRLNGDNSFSLTYSKAAVPKELMVAKTAKELFRFIAQHIDSFIKEHHYDHYEHHVRRRETMSNPEGYRDEHIFRLGFTFSFPVEQVGINKGFLIRWTKGFDIPDAIGKDVCALLQEEIDLLHLPVKVAALVNDTVGTLMARSYTSPGKTGALLGAIFGTGTNGAYIEKLSKIKKKLEGEYDESTGEMVLNTEWGSFDNQLNVLPNTTFDIKLDSESVNPGIQMFEKRVSGMFLGEILRIVLVSLLQDKSVQLFHDDNSNHNDWKSTTTIAPDSGIFKKWGLDSAIMSVAALDNTPDLGTLRQELDTQLDVYSPSMEDAQAVKAIADAIGRRAARLSAVAVGGIVLQSGLLADPTYGDEPIDIGVDGSLVEHYPHFRTMIYDALKAIDGIGEKGAERIRIGIAKDGSGVGAALIALVAASMEKKQPTAAESLKQVRDEALLQNSGRQLSAVNEVPELTTPNEEAIDA
ncbi:hexokinase [Sporothrix brasiliensis 5110]|uniref:Phosphotransferase n=1 Tax=Sporothrix brasiliensis 5110 TaxID=1398154 RepID=A0A0C2IXM9_9PEZI|nr:hexokinase [Sporothrix brasiliensis 5110]KIH91505.1 hexokinase [Sporothrix brasiliensis 5110]